MNEATLSQSNQPKLAIHEWLAVMTIISFLLTLTGISIFFSQDTESIKSGSPHYLKPQEFEVLIEGAVQNPGPIKVKAGTTRMEAIEMAKPLPEADLRKIKASSKLRNGQIIKVPAKEMIEISIIGEVKTPGKLSVPKGTRLQELGNYITLRPDADSAKIRKKRRLKAGEEVVIPKMKAKRAGRKEAHTGT